MFDIKESLYINFTDLIPMEKRGTITKFNISLTKIENYWEIEEYVTQYFTVLPDAFEWSVNGLDNYTEYVVSITPYTHVGPGPSRNVTYRTAINSKFIIFYKQNKKMYSNCH